MFFFFTVLISLSDNIGSKKNKDIKGKIDFVVFFTFSVPLGKSNKSDPQGHRKRSVI